MKLGPDIYLLRDFHVKKRKGVNGWAGGGTSKKPPKHGLKLTIFPHFNIT